MISDEQRVVVITGAARGLGRAVAEALAGPLTRLVLSDIDTAGLEQTVRGIAGRGLACRAFAADVTRPENVQSLFADVVKTEGRLDTVVNNAGWTHKKTPIEELTNEDYRATMAANLDSIFFVLKEAVPIMKRQGFGTIVNIASRAGKRGHGGLAAYAASKFGVLGLTQSVGWELEGSGVSCVAVCPAGINTPMRAKLFGTEDAAAQQTPEAVAKVIADIVTGKLAVPNGGDITIRNGIATDANDPLHG